MFKPVYILLTMLMAMTACSSIETSQTAAARQEFQTQNAANVFAEGAAHSPQQGIAGLVSDSTGDVLQQPQDVQPDSQQRIILKNGTLTIISEDPSATINDITLMAEAWGGWVVSSNVNSFTNSAGEQATRGTVTVRVPAERLTESMETIKQAAISVSAENITGSDVTQEYVDIASRLRNLQASEEQLQILMDRAETVEDILAIQQQLTTIRGDIESLQGRINYFDEAAAFSSLHVDVNPPSPGVLATQSSGWNPGETVENAVGALVRLLQFTVDFGISALILGLPFLLVIGLPLRWFWRRYKNRSKPAPITQADPAN